MYENLSGDLLAAFKIAIISRHDELLNAAVEDSKSHFNVSNSSLISQWDLLNRTLCNVDTLTIRQLLVVSRVWKPLFYVPSDYRGVLDTI